MFHTVVTCTGSKVSFGLPANRGSRSFGIRFVARVAAGESLAEAYTGLVYSLTQVTNNPNAGNYQTPRPATESDNIPIVDDSMYNLCSPVDQYLIGPAGQVVDVYLTEGEAEDIYPAGYAVIASGSGGNPSGSVATYTQLFAPDYVPTGPLEGASIANAKGLRLYLIVDDAWVDGGLIKAYRYEAGVGAWIRCPGNDTTVPDGSAALGHGVAIPIGLPDLAYTVGPSGERTLYVPTAGAVGALATAIDEILQVQT